MNHFDSLLATLSEDPDVFEFLSSGSYLTDMTEDEVTYNNILNSCFSIVLDNIKNMGISFVVGTEDLLDNYYDASTLTSFYRYMHPIYISSICKDLPETGEAILTILDDSPTNEAITDLMMFMKEEFPSNDYDQMVHFLSDKIISTDTYVEAVREMIDQKELDFDFDINVVISKLTDAKNLLIKMKTELLGSQFTFDKEYLDKTEETLFREVPKMCLNSFSMYLSDSSEVALNVIMESANRLRQTSMNFIESRETITEDDIAYTCLTGVAMNSVIPGMVDFDEYMEKLPSTNMVILANKIISIITKVTL